MSWSRSRSGRGSHESGATELRFRRQFDATPLAILIPIYDDWASAQWVIQSLDRELMDYGITATVFIVDDDSSEPPGDEFPDVRLSAIESVHIVRLRRNLGHQRAISVGLGYLEADWEFQAVVVMDGDGEDDPKDVPRLIERLRSEGGLRIVFAERRRRSEGLLFSVGYNLFRVAHWILTGRRIRVGNFSAIPRSRLESLVAVPEMWNHYAAAALMSRQPYTTVPTKRAARFAGRGKMTNTALVVHGMSAISVYSDLVGVRLLVSAAAIFALSTLGIGAVLIGGLLMDITVPEWAGYSTGLLFLIVLQTIAFSVLFIFTVLGNRKRAAVLPMRDFSLFIRNVDQVYTATRNPSANPSGAR